MRDVPPGAALARHAAGHARVVLARTRRRSRRLGPAFPRAAPGARRAPRLPATGMPLASSASTVMTVFLVAVLVLGYVVLWALWHFVFRGRDAEHPDRRR